MGSGYFGAIYFAQYSSDTAAIIVTPTVTARRLQADVNEQLRVADGS